VAVAGDGLRGEGTMCRAKQGRCGGIPEEADGEAGRRGGEGMRACVDAVRTGVAGSHLRRR
jgi:hypothetical protein